MWVYMSELDWVFSIHEFLELLNKMKIDKLTEGSLRALEFDCQYFASKCTISMREEREKLLEHLVKLRKKQEIILTV